jgi:glutamine synthetase
VFLGDVLTDLFEQIESASVQVAKKGGELDTGVSFLPKLPRDAGDRNRTSPFAFTGNKFEFRAVSSGQSIAMPNIALNVAVADALDSIATELEAAVAKGKKAEEAAWELLPGLIKEHKRIIFNGNNYADEWQQDAARRGLLNQRNTVDSLPELTKPETIKVFEKHKVLNERELKARAEINYEAYNKTVNIEAQLMVLLANRYIMPAALDYQRQVAQAVSAVKAAGGNGSQPAKLLDRLSTLIDELKTKADELAHLLEHSNGSSIDHAKYMRDKVIPLMTELRDAGDGLEILVPHGAWPLPTYREMLFIK